MLCLQLYFEESMQRQSFGSWNINKVHSSRVHSWRQVQSKLISIHKRTYLTKTLKCIMWRLNVSHWGYRKKKKWKQH